jgi:AbrB family looped-hinge helix DNA binding protein
MATATIAADGHIEIPNEILERLALRVGDRLDIVVDKDRAILMRPKTLKPSEVSGMLASRPHMSVPFEDVDEALAEAFRKGEL